LIFIFKEGENCCLKLNCFRGKFLTLLDTVCVCTWRHFGVRLALEPLCFETTDKSIRDTHTRFTFSNPLGGDSLSWTCPPHPPLFTVSLSSLSSSQSGRIWSDGRRLETCSDDNLQQSGVELSSQLIIWLISIPGPIPKFPVVKK
jgi:hypothetical protein